MILLLAVPFAAALLQEPAQFPYQRWEAATDSRVGFDADSTLHEFSGESKFVQAFVHADLARIGETAGGEVWFLVKDLSTGKDDRDENMRGDLDAEHFPRIRFQLDGLTGQLAATGAAPLHASGSFSIHGVERPRTFPVSVERLTAEGLHIRGDLRFLQTDHGIEPHSTFGLVKVHDEVKVWFDLTLHPVRSQSRSGTRAAVSVSEIVRIPGEPDRTGKSQAALWIAGDEALLVGPSEWWLAGGTGPALRLDPRAGAVMAAAPAVEEAFAQAQTRLTSLQEKLAALAPDQRARAGQKLEQTIARLAQTLASAPAAGAAEIVRGESRVEIKLGGKTWAILEGLNGEVRVPAALAAIPDLPAAVRAALTSLRGTPTRAWILIATPSGVREMEISIATPVGAALPGWALDPKAW